MKKVRSGLFSFSQLQIEVTNLNILIKNYSIRYRCLSQPAINECDSEVCDNIIDYFHDDFSHMASGLIISSFLCLRRRFEMLITSPILNIFSKLLHQAVSTDF